MRELDSGNQRRLLGELQSLRDLLGPESAVAHPGGTDAPSDPTDSDDATRPEPPLLDDIVDDTAGDPDALDARFAAFVEGNGAGDDTDWTSFVDQVFAQTSGVALPADGTGSTRTAARTDDALLDEMIRRLDARLATLRATMIEEMRAMLARRRNA